MTHLKRYCVHYTVNGQPDSLMLEEYQEPGFERIELEILLKHVKEPRAATDQTWETPVTSSESARLVELGVSDIRVVLEP